MTDKETHAQEEPRTQSDEGRFTEMVSEQGCSCNCDCGTMMSDIMSLCKAMFDAERAGSSEAEGSRAA